MPRAIPLLALAIGLLYVAPYLWLAAQGAHLFYSPYGLAPTHADGTMPDSLFYFTLLRPVMTQGAPARDGYTWEGRHGPVQPEWLGIALTGWLGRLAGDVERLRLILHFLCPAFSALLFGWFVYRLFGQVRPAIFAIGILCLGMYPAMVQPLALRWGLAGNALANLPDAPIIAGVGPFDRVLHPAVSFPFVVLALLALLSAVAHGGLRQLLSAGAACAALVYLHAFYWPWVWASVGIYALFEMGCGERHTAMRAGLVLLLAALGSVGFWVLVWRLPIVLRQDVLERTSLYHSHLPWLAPFLAPSWGGAVLHLAGAAGLVRLYVRVCSGGIPRNVALLVISLLLGAIAAMNQHVLTGMTLDPQHFYYRAFKPALAIVLALALDGLAVFCASKIRPAVFSGIFLGVLFLAGALVQIDFARLYRERERVAWSGGEAEILAWLDQHAPAHSVVLADLHLTPLVPLYTHCHVFWAPGYALRPTAELLERSAAALGLYGLPAAARRGPDQPYLALLQWVWNAPDWLYRAPDAAKIAHAWQALVARADASPLSPQVGDLRLDYVVIREHEPAPDHWARLVVPDAWQQAATGSGWRIYRVLHRASGFSGFPAQPDLAQRETPSHGGRGAPARPGV